MIEILIAENYFDIDFITDDDREILFEISKSYDYIEPQREIIPKELAKNYEKSKNTPWDDYNNRTSIFDIIADDFIIVRQDSKKFHIKRHGATSTHSGYVFKDTGGMYLFSTGTIYNSEEYYTPFKAFSCKYFNNDYSEASRDLYKKGFGDRVKIKPVFELEKIEIKKEYLDFPIDIFEKPIQDYIMQCAVTLNNSIDYMGCSLLFCC
jgi:hypothetical protein